MYTPTCKNCIKGYHGNHAIRECKLLRKPYIHLACLSAALQASYVITRSHKNHKVNEHIDNLVFVVVAALRYRTCRKTAARNPGIYRR